MTVGGWIAFVVIAALIIGFAQYVVIDELNGTKFKTLLISCVVVVGILCVMLFYYNGTAMGKRAFKTQESELNDGIYRTVRVYSMDGQLIQEYNGKFDVDYDDNRIIVDDDHDKRHIIYYPTGTVIIDEVDG